MLQQLRALPTTAARWQMVMGPLAGVIATLLDIGWEPGKPDVWHTPENTVWWMTSEPMDMSRIQKEFFRLSDQMDWKVAARHRTGSGAEDGVILQPAYKVRNRLVGQKDHMAVGFLDCIQTAGIWTNKRCCVYTWRNGLKFGRRTMKLRRRRLWRR